MFDVGGELIECAVVHWGIVDIAVASGVFVTGAAGEDVEEGCFAAA